MGLLLAGLLAASTAAADADLGALAPYENRPVAAIGLVGHTVTREHVITREIRTRVGEAFHVATLVADVQRLENLSLFAEIGVGAEPEGEGLRLLFSFKEMPSWVPLVGFSYTEEDGFASPPRIPPGRHAANRCS